MGKNSITGKANGSARSPRSAASAAGVRATGGAGSAGRAGSGTKARPGAVGRPGVGRKPPVEPRRALPELSVASGTEPGVPAQRLGWREAIERTVCGLGYEVVDVERALRGLLRITIDRVAGAVYPTGESQFVLVEDCEAVTRQLQYVLEVEGLDYARLEVSSPGLDRPIRSEADYSRFAGEQVSITLKLPFQGRKVFKGMLGRAQAQAGQAVEQDAGWTLVFQDGKNEQVLAFTLDEVREARLVPVVNFKGRQGKTLGAEQETASPALDGGQGQ